jgi:hypothetical protein
MNKRHIGSNLDDFFREEQLHHTVEATAVKRWIAFQIESEMKRCKLTKTEMANRMKTSRAGLEQPNYAASSAREARPTGWRCSEQHETACSRHHTRN